jgi:hypothetical protein
MRIKISTHEKLVQYGSKTSELSEILILNMGSELGNTSLN